MRISDWSSDVCSSDLIETVALPWQDAAIPLAQKILKQTGTPTASVTPLHPKASRATREQPFLAELLLNQPITGRDSDKDKVQADAQRKGAAKVCGGVRVAVRTEEHTSELQSLMRISYAGFCLKKKNEKLM